MTPRARVFPAPVVGAILALALVVLSFAAALAQPAGWETGTDGLKPIPALSARVTDLTGTLSAAERSTLEAKLGDWERETGNQLAVLLVPSTQPEPIEAYSIRVADAWKIGRKGQDNGAILVVAKDDRKLRLEVGYGFEGVLTDATSRRIIAETITPLFRQGQFAAGINAGVDRIMGVVGKGQPLPPPKERTNRGRGFSLETLLVLVFVVVPILGGVLRRIFGKFFGATIGAGLVGAGAWIVAGSILIGVAAAVVSWIVLLFIGMGGGGGLSSGGRRGSWGGGPWIGGGWGGGRGGGFGGGGWSGGGGGFGGGGASGGW
jgi:uncharacterized protein